LGYFWKIVILINLITYLASLQNYDFGIFLLAGTALNKFDYISASLQNYDFGIFLLAGTALLTLSQ
jgi:hypothetical protein